MLRARRIGNNALAAELVEPLLDGTDFSLHLVFVRLLHERREGSCIHSFVFFHQPAKVSGKIVHLILKVPVALLHLFVSLAVWVTESRAKQAFSTPATSR